ncbi:hypothetical protein PAXRUDRAFT_168565 [Paxillus rubicundulus Ve08.2h10]|uniref:Uncharacterized protein n=1 Tax=Paxillus rubicundulus Ve08.2h10 TaxID=930991 RepID=A0A0D0DG69_9AGAM|nr:hypothetical protein PAXRUDRAFT_168565 [Paxillus rubicundulus Ve08.2h10]
MEIVALVIVQHVLIVFSSIQYASTHTPFWKHWHPFLLVKGINEHMPPLLTSTDIVSSPGESTCFSSILHLICLRGSPFPTSLSTSTHASLAISHTHTPYTSPSISAHSPHFDMLPPSLRTQSELSPIMYYGHLCNLHGSIFSQHYPMLMSHVLT